MEFRTTNSRVLLCLLIGFFAFIASVGAQDHSARILVSRVEVSASSGASIDSSGVRSMGFERIGSYPAFEVFKGPAPEVPRVLRLFHDRGYSARPAPELDSIVIYQHRLDADTGTATPPLADGDYVPSGDRGLYLLVFDSFPTAEQIAEVHALGITFIDPLPPQTYIVRALRTLVTGILRTKPFIRQVLPLTPAMKLARLVNADSSEIYHPVVIDALEESARDLLLPFLTATAEAASVAVTDRTGTRVQYSARLSAVDLATLARFEQVFTLTPVTPVAPSGERQGAIVLQPNQTGGSITLPSSYAAYDATLISKGITDFSNTKVALVDTGFDSAYLGNHPDFTSDGTSSGVPFVVRSTNRPNGTTIQFDQTSDSNLGSDNISHGTMTTSVLSGYQPTTIGRQDSDGYRYALGIAPGVATAVDKFFSGQNPPVYPPSPVDLSNAYNRLVQALADLSVWHPNVMNHSWNGHANTCDYENYSQLLDKSTRTDQILHVVSSGNSNEAQCSTVQTPATGKNVMAVGGTESITQAWPNNTNLADPNDPSDMTPWNYYISNQDTRNIASFSGRGVDVNTTLLKPDLVAPALRITGPLSRYSPWSSLNGIFCNMNIASYSGSGVTYGFSAGTSFAAPIVSGAATVVRKWYRNLYGTDPSPAMAKAMLVNGALDLHGGSVRQINQNGSSIRTASVGFIPDIYQGWGLVSLTRLLGAAGSYYHLDQGAVLNSGTNYWSTALAVSDGSVDTRISIAYTDRFSATLGTGALVNNLDVRVCNAQNTVCWYGNDLVNGYSEARTPSNPYSDSLNNVEVILIPAGAVASGQQLVVTVTAVTLMSDALNPGNPDGINPEQDFALFASNLHTYVSSVKGDFNGDGQTDILWRNYATGQNAVWLMNGTSYSETVDLPGLPNTNYRIEGVGDFNGDGKMDILWRNYATGQNAVWLMNGTSYSETVDLPGLPDTNYRIEGVGDFNGDGKMDILWRNYATGQNAVWLMNGTSLVSIVDLPGLSNLNYRFDAVADYNGDGKPDIVLRNYATGRDAIWIMNGTVLSTVVDLPGLTDTSWSIVGPK